MNIPGTKKTLIRRFEECPKEIQTYFEHLPKLIDEFPYEVSLSYLFYRVEYAHNMTLYCGVTKVHEGQKDVVSNIIHNHHLTRDGFSNLFESVFGGEINKSIAGLISEAEKIRDRVVHGKTVLPADMRRAITRVLEYAEQFNEFVSGQAGFTPFNDLRGFKGAAKSLSKKTTRWVMKGLGFAVQ